MPGHPDGQHRRRRPTRDGKAVVHDDRSRRAPTVGQGSATVLVTTTDFGSTAGLHGHHDHQVAPPAGASALDSAARFAATIRAMPMWRCPHCGTPQAETARCWVCRRSTTACAHLPALPPLGRRPARLLRARPAAAPAPRRRDPGLLGGAGRVVRGSGRADPRGAPHRLAVIDGRRPSSQLEVRRSDRRGDRRIARDQPADDAARPRDAPAARGSAMPPDEPRWASGATSSA